MEDFVEETSPITTLYQWSESSDGQHATLIANYFMDYYGNKKPFNCNVTSSDGFKFETHKEILAGSKMFRSIMKSHKVEDGEMEIFIPFVNKDRLKTILDFLYCGQIRCGSEEEADQIIRILTYDLQLLPEDADISPNFGTFDCQICHQKIPEDSLFFHMRDTCLAKIIRDSHEDMEMNRNIKCIICQQSIAYLGKTPVHDILYHYYNHETRAIRPRDQDGLDKELYNLPVKTEIQEPGSVENNLVLSEGRTLCPDEFEGNLQTCDETNETEDHGQESSHDYPSNVNLAEEPLFSSEEEDIADDDSVCDPDFQPLDTTIDSIEQQTCDMLNSPGKPSTSRTILATKPKGCRYEDTDDDDEENGDPKSSQQKKNRKRVRNEDNGILKSSQQNKQKKMGTTGDTVKFQCKICARAIPKSSFNSHIASHLTHKDLGDRVPIKIFDGKSAKYKCSKCPESERLFLNENNGRTHVLKEHGEGLLEKISAKPSWTQWGDVKTVEDCFCQRAPKSPK